MQKQHLLHPASRPFLLYTPRKFFELLQKVKRREAGLLKEHAFSREHEPSSTFVTDQILSIDVGPALNEHLSHLLLRFQRRLVQRGPFELRIMLVQTCSRIPSGVAQGLERHLRAPRMATGGPQGSLTKSRASTFALPSSISALATEACPCEAARCSGTFWSCQSGTPRVCKSDTD